MRDRRQYAIFATSLVAWFSLAGVGIGASLVNAVNITRCGSAPEGGVHVTAQGGGMEFAVRSNTPTSEARIVYQRPLPAAGKEFFVLEARSRESTGLALCVARITVESTDGKATAVYEPDIRFPPEWNQRTIPLREFTGTIPERIGTVTLSLWVPSDIGREFHLWVRRCEFLSRAEVAARLALPAGTPRPARKPEALPVPPAYRHWTSFGPGGGGWYRVMAISPHDSTLFAGADVGGIYRSRDRGKTWQICNTGIPNLYINTFAFDPRQAQVVYAGSNDGVLKSTDGGSTWSIERSGFPPILTFGESAPISALAVDPVDSNVVYAGVGHERNYGRLRPGTVGGRIYKSTDGGITWHLTELPGGAPARTLSVLSIQFHSGDHNRLYASTQGGLFASADAGASWTSQGSIPKGSETTFFAIKRDQPDIFLLAYHTGPHNRGGVLKSTDGGTTWHDANAGLPAKPDAWRIVADPADANTFYVGWHRRAGLYITHDCGDSWGPVNTSGNIHSAWFFVGENVTGLAIDPRDPRRLVYCNDMEIYQTLDAGKTWDQVCTNLVKAPTLDHPAVWHGRGCEILCVRGPQAIAVDPTNPRTLYFGYWDTHCWKSDDGGNTCCRLTNGISSGYGRMGCVALDPANTAIVYLSKGRNYDQQRVYKSIDGGREFHLVGYQGSGLPPGGIFSLVIDPTSPLEHRVLYATDTGFGVYKSVDGGLSWHDASNGLPADSRMPKQLVIDPRNPERLFLASGAHSHTGSRKRTPGYLARTVDGGAHWQIVKSHIEPQCVLIDPFDSQKIYAGNRNFSGLDYPNALYRSTDGGDTWTSVDQAPFLKGPGSHGGDRGTRVYVSCLAADPTTPGLLYAACIEEGYDISNGRGVFISRDWGRTWEPFPLVGLSNYRIGTLVVDPVNPSRLYVGTGGDGFFRFGPPPQ